MTYLYSINNPISIWLNDLFSTRIECMLKFFNTYNINLFGNKLILVSSENAILLKTKAWILDNSFVHILLRYGLVIYIIFATYFKKIFYLAYKEKNTILIIIVFLLVIYGMMETYLFKFTYNVFILYIGKLLYREELKNE
jgi:hypothetical protein